MRTAHGRTARLLALLLVGGLAGACGGPETGPLDPGAGPGPGGQPAPTAAPVAAPLPGEVAEATPADTYIYTPVGKRDPFKSFYKEEKKPGAGGEKGGTPTTELQLYEIDQLTLIAVVSGISQPKAMVITPDGRGHTVKIGTLIGKNFGRVVRIKTSELVIAEDYRDPIGRKVTNYITMALELEKK